MTFSSLSGKQLISRSSRTAASNHRHFIHNGLKLVCQVLQQCNAAWHRQSMLRWGVQARLATVQNKLPAILRRKWTYQSYTTVRMPNVKQMRKVMATVYLACRGHAEASALQSFSQRTQGCNIDDAGSSRSRGPMHMTALADTEGIEEIGSQELQIVGRGPLT